MRSGSSNASSSKGHAHARRLAVALGAGREAVARQQPHHLADRVDPAGPRSAAPGGHLGQPHLEAEVVAHALEHLLRRAVAPGPRGPQQQGGEQVVVPLGEGDEHLRVGQAVELRRPAGPRSPPPLGAPELGLEEPVLHELVEVEAGQAPVDAHGRGHVVLGLLAPRRAHREEHAPPGGVAQGLGEATDVAIRALLRARQSAPHPPPAPRIDQGYTRPGVPSPDMRSRYLVVAALPFLLAGAGPALAAWTPPERASVDPGEARAPDVAVNPRGAAVAAWVRTLPGGVPEIVATVRAAGRRRLGAGGRRLAPRARRRRPHGRDLPLRRRRGGLAPGGARPGPHGRRPPAHPGRLRGLRPRAPGGGPLGTGGRAVQRPAEGGAARDRGRRARRRGRDLALGHRHRARLPRLRRPRPAGRAGPGSGLDGAPLGVPRDRVPQGHRAAVGGRRDGRPGRGELGVPPGGRAHHRVRGGPGRRARPVEPRAPAALRHPGAPDLRPRRDRRGRWSWA